jgi:DNA-binding NtrC family response regulator
MPRMWRVLHSLFAGLGRDRLALPYRVPIVALVVDERDRRILAGIADRELLDIHFAESCGEVCSAAKQLIAPVVFLDRDWPGTEWKTDVQRLAASPHHACVILISAVADVYLWEEVIRRGGYDVLPKPLQADKVARIVKLATSYGLAHQSRASAGKV